MNRDTLSDLLRTVRLRGAVFYYVSYGDEWAAEAPAARDIGHAVMPGVEHVMAYHMIAKGNGWAATSGASPARLGTGDVVVFPHGDAHVMASAPKVKGYRVDPEWVFATRNDPTPIPITYHEGVLKPGSIMPVEDAHTVLVCGFLGCDLRPFNPLVSVLPRLLHVPAERAGSWTAPVIAQAAAEWVERRPGGSAVLERLSEMIFVDTVRRYLDGLPEDARGWLAGLRDRHVGRALGMMHEQPDTPWTVDDLAREVGLSRSALHERFVQCLDQPPMQYLANWRIQVGSTLLRDTKRTVASIAQDVGYESEAAFSRAFKRLVGTPPAAWRREQGTRAAAADERRPG